MSLKRANWRSVVPLADAICLLATVNVFASNAPLPVSEIALYHGADREKVLIEGAKREGQLTFYNSHTWFRSYVKEFEKKYPFIKVSEWRSDSKNLLSRAMAEFGSTRSLVDVIETTAEAMGGDETERHVSGVFYSRGALLPRRCQSKREKRALLSRRSRDV